MPKGNDSTRGQGMDSNTMNYSKNEQIKPMAPYFTVPPKPISAPNINMRNFLYFVISRDRIFAIFGFGISDVGVIIGKKKLGISAEIPR